MRRANPTGDAREFGLTPCPFCGSMNIHLQGDVSIMCEDCYARTREFDDISDAWASWGRHEVTCDSVESGRASPHIRKEQSRFGSCPFCGDDRRVRVSTLFGCILSCGTCGERTPVFDTMEELMAFCEDLLNQNS